MKEQLTPLVEQALAALARDGTLTTAIPAWEIERTRDTRFGDFACNVAMVAAKAAGQKPRDLAQRIAACLPASPLVARVEIAGPGFLNFYLREDALTHVIPDILAAGERYGHSTQGGGRRMQVEFVSANPTGPLHVGHGRGAAYGATLANLLSAAGYTVHREYYVNDAGRQMDILATSTWLRYLDLAGEKIVFPSNGYQGDYVWDIAASLHRERGDAFRHAAATVFVDIPPDAPTGDKEHHIDALIARARTLLGPDQYRAVFDRALDVILGDIRQDLAEFGVTYDEWFSERSLTESGEVDKVITRLQASGHVYEKEGALWFRSTDYGDEKDRVVVRENGQKTYFASDIAYHAQKFARGYDRIVDVWGADHHGYIPRVKAALSTIGEDPTRLDVQLVQFAILYRGGERAQMSTRSGEFVTLRELRDEVGNDAARFFYVLRAPEQHMDFDLDLAKSQSSDNPVYYVQYAHARVCSVFRQLAGKGLGHDRANGLAQLARLTETHEQQLITTLSRYPEVIVRAALEYAPHLLAYYLRELANALHAYYHNHTFIVDDVALRNARLVLIDATRQVLANGLGLLGVSAPQGMSSREAA